MAALKSSSDPFLAVYNFLTAKNRSHNRSHFFFLSNISNFSFVRWQQLLLRVRHVWWVGVQSDSTFEQSCQNSSILIFPVHSKFKYLD